MSSGISRRNVLKSLAMGAAATSVLRVIPAQAAEYAHHMIAAEKAATPAKAYAPKFFAAHDYKTLQTLCQTIFPADSDSGGAIEAGAPEFIDLLTSENKEYQAILGGGLMWLENTCTDRYGLLERSAERNPRPDRLSQEHDFATCSRPWRRVLLIPPEHDRGRFLHQRNWN
jgi:hypothetical protein